MKSWKTVIAVSTWYSHCLQLWQALPHCLKLFTRTTHLLLLNFQVRWRSQLRKLRKPAWAHVIHAVSSQAMLLQGDWPPWRIYHRPRRPRRACNCLRGRTQEQASEVAPVYRRAHSSRRRQRHGPPPRKTTWRRAYEWQGSYVRRRPCEQAVVLIGATEPVMPRSRSSVAAWPSAAPNQNVAGASDHPTRHTHAVIKPRSSRQLFTLTSESMLELIALPNQDISGLSRSHDVLDCKLSFIPIITPRFVAVGGLQPWLLGAKNRLRVYECYCVLYLLGFNYFMSVRRRWAPVRSALSNLLRWWWWWWWLASPPRHWLTES